MQWLHFVKELDCYKGKENTKQLLNIRQVLCSHNIVTNIEGYNPHFLKTGGPIKN